MNQLSQASASDKAVAGGDPAHRLGSKIIKLLLTMKDCPDTSAILVEFHLKILYSVQKNKKSPAYMLKSILISLDKIKFDRLSFKNRALEMIKLIRPNCYEIMIEIFSMK